MPVEQIEDPSVKIRPPSKLIQFIRKNVNVKEAPESLRAVKKSHKPEALLKIKDIKWLNEFLIEYRKKTDTKVYIHELLEGADVILPEPKVTPRNPVLEARIQKLTAQQSAREYEAMTKGVDPIRKYYPEDTISYQSKYQSNFPKFSMEFISSQFSDNFMIYFTNCLMFYLLCGFIK
uniref:TMEM199_0 protein n=1 Tax=Fopius arisanus TaxID=64838 RepID=A0A0C9RYI2_9HYME